MPSLHPATQLEPVFAVVGPGQHLGGIQLGNVEFGRTQAEEVDRLFHRGVLEINPGDDDGLEFFGSFICVLDRYASG